MKQEFSLGYLRGGRGQEAVLREFTFLTLSLTVGLFIFYYWSTKLNSHSSFDVFFCPGATG